MASTTVQSGVETFFEFMQLGQYQCSAELCEISEKRVIWLEQKHTYSIFGLGSVSGFVLAIGALGEGVHEAEVNWDDGSGKPNRETVRIQSLGDESFLFTDNQGRRNLMKLARSSE